MFYYVFFFQIRHLCTKQDWTTARELFKIEYAVLDNDTIFSHFWTYYFPEIPRWGNVAHKAGEVHSVQGLEKSWDLDKKTINDERNSSSTKNIDLRHIFAGISNR